MLHICVLIYNRIADSCSNTMNFPLWVKFTLNPELDRFHLSQETKVHMH